MVYNAKKKETRNCDMKGENVRIFKPFDVLIFLLIAATALIIPFTALSDTDAEFFIVSVDGEESIYPLHTDISLTEENEGHTLYIVCKDGTVFVQSSDCSDQVCVESGAISKPSEIIVCAPAKVSVKITGEGDYDGTVK